MSYNPIERKLAQLLSSFPGIKSKLKYAYQWTNRFFNQPKEKFNSSYTIHEVKPNTGESFWGYYDHSPLNITNQFLLFHESENLTQKPPQKSTSINLVLRSFEKSEDAFKINSSAYNWQQGTKAMWLDEHRFIFNDSENKQLISRIIDTKDSFSNKKLPFPIYDCKKDWGLTLNFDRLTAFRPDYGYRSSAKNIDKQAFKDTSDGIFLVNLQSQTKKLIISLKELAKQSQVDSGSNAQWVNHIMISPEGNQFMFLHRWLDGGLKKDALYISDKNGENLKCLLNEAMVSHCFWKNEEIIIGYMRTEKGGDSYYQINIKENKIQKLDLKTPVNIGDGHPSIYENKMIFDTYPDRRGMKHLYLYSFTKEKLIELGAFYEPLKYYEETRCDLHPRFSKDGKKVFFDSVHSGKRRLYYIDLEENK